MPRFASRSLTPNRTRTNIRHHPSMCCFHCPCPSFVLRSSSRPGQFQLVPRVCLYVYLFALLSISLSIELLVSLVSLLIAISPSISSLSLVVTSLVCGCGSYFLMREYLPFVFLFTCAVQFLENGCKDSRNVEIYNNMFINAAVIFSFILRILPSNRINVIGLILQQKSQVCLSHSIEESVKFSPS
jgi:hypothetical protein